jgi:peptidoglycan hydrolase-like protein with peptidoglycan-binding domain
MKKLVFILFFLAHAANAQVPYRWFQSAVQGHLIASVYTQNGRFDISCDVGGIKQDLYMYYTPQDSKIFESQHPDTYQIVLDNKTFIFPGSGMFVLPSAFVTFDAKNNFDLFQQELMTSNEPYFQLQIPEYNLSVNISTAGANSVFYNDPNDASKGLITAPCLGEAPPPPQQVVSQPTKENLISQKEKLISQIDVTPTQSNPLASPVPAINPLTGPSFPCPQPEDPLAQLICITPQLAMLDMQFVQTYEALYQQAGPSGEPTVRQLSVQFDVAVRNQCGIALSQTSDPSPTPPPAAPAGSAACVAPAYQQQISLWKSMLHGPALEEANRSIDQQVALQTRLQTLGFLPALGQLDGVFGPATRVAITNWQSSQGRTPTGLLSDADAQALLGNGAASTPETPNTESQPVMGTLPVAMQPAVTAPAAQSATQEQSPENSASPPVSEDDSDGNSPDTTLAWLGVIFIVIGALMLYLVRTRRVNKGPLIGLLIGFVAAIIGFTLFTNGPDNETNSTDSTTSNTTASQASESVTPPSPPQPSPPSDDSDNSLSINTPCAQFLIDIKTYSLAMQAGQIMGNAWLIFDKTSLKEGFAPVEPLMMQEQKTFVGATYLYCQENPTSTFAYALGTVYINARTHFDGTGN